MTPEDREELERKLEWATRQDQGVWGLLHWMSQHGTGCTLRYVLRIPAWVCEWAHDDCSLFGQGAEPQTAVRACARRALTQDGV